MFSSSCFISQLQTRSNCLHTVVAMLMALHELQRMRYPLHTVHRGRQLPVLPPPSIGVRGLFISRH